MIYSGQIILVYVVYYVFVLEDHNTHLHIKGSEK